MVVSLFMKRKPPPKRARIEAILKQHPDWGARRIAREAGCSLSYAQRVREELVIDEEAVEAIKALAMRFWGDSNPWRRTKRELILMVHANHPDWSPLQIAKLLRTTTKYVQVVLADGPAGLRRDSDIRELREYFRLAIRTIHRLDELLPKLELLEKRIATRLLKIEQSLGEDGDRKTGAAAHRRKTSKAGRPSQAMLRARERGEPPAPAENELLSLLSAAEDPGNRPS